MTSLEARRQALLDRFHAGEVREGDGEALRRLNAAIERERRRG
jgi:hypothetical protein